LCDVSLVSVVTERQSLKQGPSALGVQRSQSSDIGAQML
jgi:hypothetical protein